jgi:hypothetical protein
MPIARSNVVASVSVKAAALLWLAVMLCPGCASHCYRPGEADNPFHRIQLGQTYGDMESLLGRPDVSRTEDQLTEEAILMFVPVWDLIELVADFHPSALHVYTYRQWGDVTINDKNHIIRVEARSP